MKKITTLFALCGILGLSSCTRTTDDSAVDNMRANPAPAPTAPTTPTDGTGSTYESSDMGTGAAGTTDTNTRTYPDNTNTTTP